MDHVKIDAESKIITDYNIIIDSSVHDSQVFENLIGEADAVVYADSAYVSQEMRDRI
ncbi:MAG: transposase [Oscillospiraceae bacterium]|nr:transposase [Oscillospiraceae bacterium]